MTSNDTRVKVNGEVRKLEWQKRDPRDLLSRAETIAGHYTVWTHTEAEGKWFWRLSDGIDGTKTATVETEAEGFAAAQAHFDSLVTSAIDPSPVSGGTGDEDLAELIDELERGVVATGMHDDGSTELFAIDDASEVMRRAAQALRAPSSASGSGAVITALGEADK